MKNKRSRIFSGFSMVEMMLLLVIVSLMLASGVAVISKRHVKVPRLAVHGAYMCYVKNGNLHEEKYLGTGLTNKILDQDTKDTDHPDTCVFTPPSRASYFHIQATGGGGGGGGAGYTGGNIITYTSATEVITPFGITDDLLELKGITSQELSDYGGKLWAYADGSGDFGDGGKGGDLYYIHQECSNDCLRYREWKYTGSKQRECVATQGSTSVRTVSKRYSYPYESSCTGRYCDYCKRYSTTSCTGKNCDAGCTEWRYEDCGSSCTASECTKWSEPDKNGVKTCEKGSRKTDYCEKGSKYTDSCAEGTNYYTGYVNCTNQYGIPESATCATENTTEPVYSKDTYADTVSQRPTYRYPNPDKKPTLTYGDDLEERQVLRDKGEEHTICNYGNTSLYKSDSNNTGIFGSFSSADGVGVGCDTASLREAYGEQMYAIGIGADTSKHTTVKLGACEAYGDKVDCTKKRAFPYFMKTETEGGLSTFGESFKNVYDSPVGQGGSNVSEPAGTWIDPDNVEHKSEQPIPTICDIDASSFYDDLGCSSYESDSKYTLVSSSTSYSNRYYTKSYSCRQPSTKKSGADCLYSYTDVAAHDPNEEYYCAYIPQVVSGGAKGIGKFCALNDVPARTGLKYKGDSSIIAGINGSDYMLMTSYEPLYTKAAWEASNNSYGGGETGTESQGYAEITLGDYTCAVHKDYVPGRGKGAFKETPGEENVKAGDPAPSDGPGKKEGSLTGTGFTTDTSRKCGDNHVGYCLRDHEDNVRENAKYTYKYTWQTNYLQYGEGGKAGEYRVKIIRSFNNKNIEITLGRGGAGGYCDGAAGTDTIVGDILTAKGGAGGRGCIPTATEQLPYYYQGAGEGAFSASQPGGTGELASVTNYKTNIINLVLPLDDSKLGEWIASSGAGGNGGGSGSTCWASEWVRWFEGEQLTGIGKLDTVELAGCREDPDNGANGPKLGNDAYSSSDGSDGLDGVVLIKW